MPILTIVGYCSSPLLTIHCIAELRCGGVLDPSRYFWVSGLPCGFVASKESIAMGSGLYIWLYTYIYICIYIYIFLYVISLKVSGRVAWGHLQRLYKAPTDYTKPRWTIQSPTRLYKAQEHYTTTHNILRNLKTTHAKPKHIRQETKASSKE